MSAGSFPVLNPNYIKTEESAGHKVSPLALRIASLTPAECFGPSRTPQFETTAQAIQFAMDAVFDEVKRLMIETTVEVVIPHPDSNPLSTTARKDK